MGAGEKLLTHLNSALKVLLGLDIFPRVPKKKLNFVDQCYYLFIKYYSPLHVSSIKCSSSGGHSCIQAAYGTATLYKSPGGLLIRSYRESYQTAGIITGIQMRNCVTSVLRDLKTQCSIKRNNHTYCTKFTPVNNIVHKII